MIDEKTYLNYEQALRAHIDKYCIVRKEMPGKAPGSTYTWMFYLRNGLFNADFLYFASEMMLYRIHKELGNMNFQVCGAETAGTPLAAAIPLVARQHKITLSGFVVRKEQKKYGLMNWHEGMAFMDIPYVLVDDLCNSSASLRHANRVCQGLGLTPTKLACVLVNKVNKGVHDKKRERTDMYLPDDFKVLSLFDLDSFDLTNPSH